MRSDTELAFSPMKHLVIGTPLKVENITGIKDRENCNFVHMCRANDLPEFVNAVGVYVDVHIMMQVL